MGLAWGIGYFLTLYLLEADNQDTTNIRNLFIGFFLSAWIGAKVFFLIFSSEEQTLQYLSANSFWLGGGFVFYGGLIFGLVFYAIFSLWLKKFPFNQSMYLVPGLVFGHALGRVGCFLTGCCYGSLCDLPWKIHLHGEWRHPVQLYEVLGLILIGLTSIRFLKNKKENQTVILFYLISYSILRFVLEFFRGDRIRGVFFLDLSTSQYISLGLLIAGCFYYLWKKSLKKLN